jgi:hypothetical protein
VIADRNAEAFQQELLDLGLTKEEASQFKGIDPTARPEPTPRVPVGEERIGGVTTPAVAQPPEEEAIPTTPIEKAEIAAKSIFDFFTGKRLVLGPFAERDQLTEIRGGAPIAFVTNLASRILEDVVGAGIATIPTIHSLITGGKEQSITLPEAFTTEQFGLDARDLGSASDEEARIVRDLGTRMFNRLQENDKNSPETPTANLLGAFFSTFGEDALNITIGGDLLFFGARAVGPKAFNDVLFRGAIRELGLDPRVLAKQKSATAMFDDVRTAYVNRVEQILKNEKIKTSNINAATELKTLEERGEILQEFIDIMRAEGSITPAQMVDLVKAHQAIQQIKFITEGGTKFRHVPQVWQRAQELAVLLNTPLRAGRRGQDMLGQIQGLIEFIRRSRRKTTIPGFIPRQPTLQLPGLRIDPIEPLDGAEFSRRAKKFMDEITDADITEDLVLFDDAGQTLVVDLSLPGSFNVEVSQLITPILNAARDANITVFVDEGKGERAVFVRQPKEDRVAEIEARAKALQEERLVAGRKGLPIRSELLGAPAEAGVETFDNIFSNLTKGQRGISKTQVNLLRTIEDLSKRGADTGKALTSFFKSVAQTGRATRLPRLTEQQAATPVGKAILDSDAVARLAEIARGIASARTFAAEFSFLTDPARFREISSEFFRTVSNAITEAKRIGAEKLFGPEVIEGAQVTRLPTGLVSFPAVDRLKAADVDAITAGLPPAADAGIALELISGTGEFGKDIRKSFLAKRVDKPNAPTFVLTDDFRAVLLNQDQATREQVAGAIFAGERFIPAVVLDPDKILPKFQQLLKEVGSLKEFQKQAIDFAPLVTPSIKKKGVPAKDLTLVARQQQLIAKGDAVALGIDESWRVVVPKKFIRNNLLSSSVPHSTGMVARERFNLSELTAVDATLTAKNLKVVTFKLGPDALLHVADSPSGLLKIQSWLNTPAMQKKLLARSYEAGNNYVVTENVVQPSTQALALLEAIQDRMLKTINKLGPLAKSEIILRDQFVEAVLNEEALLNFYIDKELVFDWEALFQYDFDIRAVLKSENWMQRPDGTLLLKDGTILDRLLREFSFIATPAEKEALMKQFTTFRNKSTKMKDLMKDYDPFRNFAFIPVPVMEETEDGKAEFDPWASIWATAFGAFARGKGGKNWRKKGKPYSKAKPPALPQPKQLAKLPPGLVGKTILNSDPFTAVTGTPFGGITYIGDSKIQQGIKIAENADLVPPMGPKALYSYFERDIANIYGKVDFRASSADNPLVINTDKEWVDIVLKARTTTVDLKTNKIKTTQQNIDNVRKYIESLGHDGLVIARKPEEGATTVLDAVFEFDQLIVFNPKNSVAVKDPKTRSKKIQTKVMKMVDPPANKLELDEGVLLRNRLKTINTAIKEGKRLGVKEARISITNRLRNSFEIKTENLKRKHELQRLKDRIFERERELIKREIEDYMTGSLPVKERGRFIKMILNARTRRDLAKAFVRVDRRVEAFQKKNLAQDIKKLGTKIINSQQISSDYRQLARDVMGTIDLTARRASTIEKIEEMKRFLDRETGLGREVTVTKKMQTMLELLSRKSIKDMTVGELVLIKNELVDIEKMGRTKLDTVKAIFEMEKEQIAKRIMQPGELNQINRKDFKERPVGLDETLSPKEHFQNAVVRTNRFIQELDLAVTPTDTMFDILGKNKGTYDGQLFVYMREKLGAHYNSFLQDVFENVVIWRDLMEETGLKQFQKERVALWMTARQEGGLERLKAMSEDPKAVEEFVTNIKLSPEEERVALYVRETLDAHRPQLAKQAREIFNIEFNAVDEFFPFMLDRAKAAELPMNERFGSLAPLFEVPAAKTKKVKHGTLKNRKAGVTLPIKLNVEEVFLAQIKDVLYMRHMARPVKMLSEIVNSNKKFQVGKEHLSYAEAQGDLGTELTKAYLDLAARGGGVAGDAQIIPLLDTIARNFSVAVLGFKLSSAIVQATALVQGATIIGTPNVVRGIAGVGQRDVRAYLRAHFPKIRERAGGDLAFLDRAKNTVLADIQDIGYLPLKTIDGLTASSVGWGAYLQRLDEMGIALDLTKPPVQEAVQYAELVVTLTQSSAFFLDAPLALSRGTGVFNNRSLNRALFKFQSFMLSNWSMIRNNAWRWGIRGDTMADRIRGIRYMFFLLVLAPAVDEGLRDLHDKLMRVLTGKEKDPDDTFLKDFLQRVLSSPPGASIVISTGVYGGSTIGVFRGIEDVSAGPLSIALGKNPSTKAKGVIDTIAGGLTLAGIPGATQFQQFFKGLIDGYLEEALKGPGGTGGDGRGGRGGSRGGRGGSR